MWSPEFVRSPNQFERAGTVQIRKDEENLRQPTWLVLLKMIASFAMLAVGYGLCVPIVPLPFWQSIVLSTGIILLYVGLAYFFIPDPNLDNMGWGLGRDDPFQTRDNINRLLFRAYCFLGPGRFIAHTLIDGFTWCGLLAERTRHEIDRDMQENRASANADRLKKIEERVTRRQSEQKYRGVQELSSMRFFKDNDGD
jgi:hypothetical protein